MNSVVLLFCKSNEVLFRDNSNQLRESTETSSNGLLYFLANAACAHPISQSGASILYFYSLLPVTAVVQLGQVCY